MLIDTNVLIDHLRNFPPAVTFIESLLGKPVYFSSITESELLAGSANNDPKKREALLHMLNLWHKIDVSNPIALLAGDLSRQYGLEIPDALIAATALTLQVELVTKDINDFKKIKPLNVRSPY